MSYVTGLEGRTFEEVGSMLLPFFEGIMFALMPQLLWDTIDDAITLINPNCAMVNFFGLDDAGRIIKDELYIEYWDRDGNHWRRDI